jgi:diguanylate cyclase
MTNFTPKAVEQLHLLAQLLQTLDNGLIMLDRNYRITLWNGFMENHSGIKNSDARDHNLFELFPELPATWLRRKIDSVFRLQSRSFCTWEEHPRIFNFSSTRPLTGHSPMMYQNITLLPLMGTDGQVAQVCMQIFDVTDVATRKIALEAANQSLKQLSRTDRLTEINNRGFWEENLMHEFQRCRRSGRVSSLLLFDIDHFKKLNDTYGHGVGDNVLRAVAAQIRSAQRNTDIAGRYGGEEFALILPETDGQQALVMAERLRQQIARLQIELDETTLHVTVSMGVSEFSTLMPSYQDWLNHCDSALYAAKKAGRNCSVLAPLYQLLSASV